MHYLKENKGLLLLLLLLVPAFYLDYPITSRVTHFFTFRYSSAYEPVNYLVKFATHGTTLIILSVIVFLAARKYNRKLSNACLTLFIGMISAGIIVQVIKHLLGRARPRVTLGTVFVGPSMHLDYDSFPSGHTSVTFCLAFILSEYYPRYRLLFYLFAIMTGFDRLLWLSHFPSDVIAGAILGTAVGKVMRAYSPPWPVFIGTKNR